MNQDVLNDFFLDPEFVSQFWRDGNLVRFLKTAVINKQSAVLVSFPTKKKWRQLIQSWRGSYEFRGEEIPAELDLLAEILINPDVSKSTFLERHGISFDGQLPWIDNVRNELSRVPAHAVFSEIRPNTEEKNFIQYAERWEHELIHNLKSSCLIERNAHDMAKALRKMFLYSSKLMFVDPYFDPSKDRFQRTLRAFLSMATKGVGRRTPLKEVTLQTTLYGAKGMQRMPYKTFCNLAKSLLPNSIPQGLQLQVKFWRKRSSQQQSANNETATQDFHNRFILTEHFGVSFGSGLDENRQISSKDNLFLLDTLTLAEIRSWFQQNSVYDTVPGEQAITIGGTAV